MKRLAKLRARKGYSQVQLAKLIGVAQNTISNWENGKREPSCAELIKLSFHLDCTVDELIGATAISLHLEDLFLDPDKTEFSTAPDNDYDHFPYLPIDKLSPIELKELLEQLHQVLDRISATSSDPDDLTHSGILLMQNFLKLNQTGRVEATKRIQELTFIPDYSFTKSE
ncbi:MAG: helix-turn-helix transcriptional regulator [Lawsonibacter sp.]